MEFRNLTPFSVMNYKMLDVDDIEHHVIVMKVGYSLAQFDGNIYQAKIKENTPLCFQDENVTNSLNSSVKFESDLSPFKPLCDVIVIGTAIAPHSKPVKKFDVNLRVTDKSNKHLIDKKLNIFGSRYFNKVNGQWIISEPEEFITLPLQYEYAFGGEFKVYPNDLHSNEIEAQYLLSEEGRNAHPESPSSPIAHGYYQYNPIGKGYVPEWYTKIQATNHFEAHRIENAYSPFDEHDYINYINNEKNQLVDDYYIPQGFGVIGRAWQPRLKKAGTYDDEWLNHRHPYLPKDFDFNYWNCAPNNQQIPYPNTDITICVTNMTLDGMLQATLPGHRAFLLSRLENGPVLPIQLNLDTVILDTDNLELSLTFRQKISLDVPIRALEARFETNPNAPLFCVDLSNLTKGNTNG